MNDLNRTLIQETALALLNRIRLQYSQPPLKAQSGFSIVEWKYGLDMAELAQSILCRSEIPGDWPKNPDGSLMTFKQCMGVFGTVPNIPMY